MVHSFRLLGLHGGPGARERLEAIASKLGLAAHLIDCSNHGATAPGVSGEVHVVVVDAQLLDPQTEAVVTQILNGLDARRDVFVCADVASMALTQVLLRLGVQQVFELGADGAVGLKEALDRRLAALRPRRARLHAILGLKGGCGATTVALELAFRSVRQLGDRAVRLVDLDFGFGRAAERIGLEASWPAADHTTSEALDPRSRHWSGLQVIGRPFQSPPYPSAPEVAQALAALRLGADTVVIDTPRSAPDLREVVLELADTVALVSDLSPTGLDLAKRTLTAFDTLLGGAREILVVFNRRPKRGDGAAFDANAIRKAINYDQLVVLDEDREAFARATLLREPVHYAAPGSPFVRAFGDYADILKTVGRKPATSIRASR